MLFVAFFRFLHAAKNGGPPPIEGIDGGPSPAYPFHPCMMTMLGEALMATAAVAGAADVVRARTGPATSEPTVPTVRMAGARMFRRTRMSASMRLPRSTAQTLVSGGPARTPLSVFFHSPVFGSYIR